MKYLLMLAAAASLAACHQRGEDEVGAAPEQGDTTAVVADTTAMPTDTTMGQTETDTSFVEQDTTMTQDTTTMTEPTPGDSALVDDQVPDTTTGAIPTDTTTGVTPTDTSTGAWTDTTSTTGQDTSGMGVPADSASQPSQ